MSDEVTKPQVPKIDEFKGNPVIILNPEDKYVFSFGLTKAKLILLHFDAIKAFIAANEKVNGNEHTS